MPLNAAVLTSRGRRRRTVNRQQQRNYPPHFFHPQSVHCMNGGIAMPSSSTSSPSKYMGHSLVDSGKTFKERRSFDDRRKDVEEIIRKHPQKIPLVIERAKSEKTISLLDKTKFLVPEELTMSQLTAIIRKRLKLTDTQSFYLIVNKKTMVSTSMTLMEVYHTQKDEDGFLYITYASQETFG